MNVQKVKASDFRRVLIKQLTERIGTLRFLYGL